MKEPIVIKSGKIIGDDHRRHNMPLQDDVLTMQKGNTIAMVVSDGCGSRYMSEVGSHITVTTLCPYLIDHFDSLYEKSTDEISREVISILIEKLIEYGNDNEDKMEIAEKNDSRTKNDSPERLKDELSARENLQDLLYCYLLSATFAFAVKKNNKMVIGRLGDCAVLAVENGYLYPISMEKKTPEEVSGTVYPFRIFDIMNHPDEYDVSYQDFFLVKKIDDSSRIDMVLLTSDGLVPVLSDFTYVTDDESYIFHPEIFDKYIFNPAKSGDSFLKQTQKMILVDYENESALGDDMSLAMMANMQFKITATIPMNKETLEEEPPIILEQPLDVSFIAQTSFHTVKELPKEVLDKVTKEGFSEEYLQYFADTYIRFTNILEEVGYFDYQLMLSKLAPYVESEDLDLFLAYVDKLDLLNLKELPRA